jgi:hypothetical protein
MHKPHAVAVMLHRVLQRDQRLRPLAVVLAVPGEVRIVRRAHQRHRVERDLPHPAAERQPVGEEEAGLVAGGAGDRAVAAEARVEEDRRAECGRGWIVGHRVGGVRRERRQACQAQGVQQRQLGLAPGRAMVPPGERQRQRQQQAEAQKKA